MKISSREKRILRLTLVVVGIALAVEVWDRYTAMKENLRQELSSTKSEIAAFTERLAEEKSPRIYIEDGERIEDELFMAREKIVELPTEAEASLMVRQTIANAGEAHGVNINSINVRRARDLDEERELKGLRTYFGFDCELEPLLKLFATLEEQPYYLSVESLTISAPVRRARRNPRRNQARTPRRSSLTGNAILTTLFVADPEGKPDRYRSSGEGAKAVIIPTDHQAAEMSDEELLQSVDPGDRANLEGSSRPMVVDADNDDSAAEMNPPSVTSLQNAVDNQKNNPKGKTPKAGPGLPGLDKSGQKPVTRETILKMNNEDQKARALEALGGQKKPPAKEEKPELNPKPKPLSGTANKARDDQAQDRDL